MQLHINRAKAILGINALLLNAPEGLTADTLYNAHWKGVVQRKEFDSLIQSGVSTNALIVANGKVNFTPAYREVVSTTPPSIRTMMQDLATDQPDTI